MNLFEMNDDQLMLAFKESKLPKWKTLCLLRYLDAPTLNARLLQNPRQSKVEIEREVRMFMTACGTNQVMIRSDLPIEAVDYARGGNSFELETATEICNSCFRLGRSVILLEPTDRLKNHASICVQVDSAGKWQGDFLGKGYDVGDLQRGAVVPEFTFNGRNFQKDTLSDARVLTPDVARVVTVDSEERKCQRLLNIGENILATFPGATGVTRDIKIVHAWLDQNGYTNLFEPSSEGIPSDLMREVIETTERVFLFYSREVPFESLVVSCSLLDQHRTVFWDVADGNKKWGKL